MGVYISTAIALLVVNFFLRLACYSLRDFSRKRLEEICQRREKPARFGKVLKQHEEALFAAELLFVLLLCVQLWAMFNWMGFPGAEAAAAGRFALAWKSLASLVLLGLTWVVFPRSIAQVAGAGYIFHLWPLLALLCRCCAPLWSLAQKLDVIHHRLAGLGEPNQHESSQINEEILSVIDEGQREGLLERDALTMIHRVMELSEEDAGSVMTPRTDMFCISINASLADARQQLLQAGHTRVPVIGKSPDDIVGILYAKDLLNYVDQQPSGGKTLKEITREPYYVPETTGIHSLLQNMKRKHVHLAIVLDEYGGVAGLVTMEDILEEIVGEIVDEYDKAEDEPITNLGPGIAEVDARVHIDDFNERFNLQLPEDGDFDTIGGFVFMQLGRVPSKGESFTWQNLKVTVLEANKRRIDKLHIEVDESLAAASQE